MGGDSHLKEMEDHQVKQGQKKGKRYDGLLEWIVDREGHEFLVEIDRKFLLDKFNLQGIREQFAEEQNIPGESISERHFSMYVKHLYKSKSPTQENLKDENYLQFI